MAFCGALFCDIIGELMNRNIYHIAERILLFLDLDDLKNVYIISENWRVAALVSYKSLVRNGSSLPRAGYRALWQKVRLHLGHSFHVPSNDPLYHLRLFNSTHLGFQHLSHGIWPNPEWMTLDYVPFNCGPSAKNFPFQVNERFIVACDPASGELSCWSRRSLAPLTMPSGFDSLPCHMEVDGVGKNFRLAGSHLILAYRDMDLEFDLDVDCSIHVVLSLDLDQGTVDTSTMFKVLIRDSLFINRRPSESEDIVFCKIHQLAVQGQLVMIVFSVFRSAHSRSQWKKFALVLSELAGLITFEDFALSHQHSLEIPHLTGWFGKKDYRFLDEDCAVFVWSADMMGNDFGFRTFSLHPPQGGGSVELRQIAEFEVKDVAVIHYAHGLLAAGSIMNKVSLVDVKTGLVRCVLAPCVFLAQNSFLDDGTLLRMSRDHLIVSSAGIPYLDTGMTFKVWDLKAILDAPYDSNNVGPASLKPICVVKTLAGKLADFKVDELGIVAVMEHGIQVLSFLPICSHCKRMTKPALLQKCVRCKLAAYCGKECQQRDWNPHHKTICFKLDPPTHAGQNSDDLLPYINLI